MALVKCRSCQGHVVRSGDLDCPRCGAPTVTKECLLRARQRGKLRPVILLDERMLREDERRST